MSVYTQKLFRLQLTEFCFGKEIASNISLRDIVGIENVMKLNEKQKKNEKNVAFISSTRRKEEKKTKQKYTSRFVVFCA